MRFKKYSRNDAVADIVGSIDKEIYESNLKLFSMKSVIKISLFNSLIGGDASDQLNRVKNYALFKKNHRAFLRNKKTSFK
jgi:hypothetical protein